MANEVVKVFVRGLYKAVGLDSPYSNQEYGPNWTKQRQKCLERDNYACRVCNKTKEEIGREPAVHHIKPRSTFDGNWKQNELENLITLCHSCHGKFEGKYQDACPDEFVRRAR